MMSHGTAWIETGSNEAASAGSIERLLSNEAPVEAVSNDTVSTEKASNEAAWRDLLMTQRSNQADSNERRGTASNEAD